MTFPPRYRRTTQLGVPPSIYLKGTIMRRNLARCVAVVALLTGIGVAASTVPAAAASASTVSTHAKARPADWWF